MQEQQENNQGKKIAVTVTILVIIGVILVVGIVAYALNNNQDEDQDAEVENQDAQVQVSQEVLNDEEASSINASRASSSSSTPDPEEEVTESTGTVITTGDSEFGTMLFDENNQAIYIWEVEESEQAECYDDCATAWPPVLTDGDPQATGDVNETLLGTTKRTDGTTQVTYNGHPLYYYAHEDPGEVKCHNISTHGGLWWVIQPDGNRAN